ncbi:DUF3516 domain-containing protein [Schaalia sp. 19OD2882]|uniref:DEAD/DEAH box helicase n=1 Tax=Schaalia sp. 19OD2882 TaxID=2794089 RepID=UPI001C1EBED5|nr:DUF3516 domain-containing protein [Schaalia sp. 19OD2882]QWW19104.1 DUF3516 domain-containing protein [Schaalia sp. 19OD2882]
MTCPTPPAAPAHALNALLDRLEDRGALGATPDADALLDAFTEWAASTGRPLYPHQEEALLEILAGNHVIAATPTGSGKSMIALAGHFVSMARGGRSYYTAPLKALVSEKFFTLVDLFGAANVGMVTGDVALNGDAPIICCTAEILANQALREGPGLDADLVVMDEFHFYGDPQRGWAWQVPLLELQHAQFVAMSATLGDTAGFEESWKRRTGRDVALVDDAERPVPLEFDYVVDDLSPTTQRLLAEGRWPVYIVHFAQKDALDTAQSFEKVDLVGKDQRERIARALSTVGFGKGFGQTLKSLLQRGVGVHHAGMLPRYRRLVERLTQEGLLAVVCGTDTLGVGINVPIRTVLVTSLVKFDGKRMRHLSAREFHQIAGRAGRAGFDTVGFVRVLAPGHEVEAARERARLSAAEAAARDEREARRARKKSSKKSQGAKQGKQGEISWTRSTYERLVSAAPERLQSRFEMSHAMVLNVLAGAEAAGRDPGEHLVHLATDNDDIGREVNPHLRRLGEIVTSMTRSGVAEHVSSARAALEGRPRLRLVGDLPDDFALNQPLSPFALAAFELLDPDCPTFTMDVISVVEAVLEDPRPLLFAQQRLARGEAVAAMKAQGMDYDERMAALEEVSWPRPLEELLGGAFDMWVRSNPWAGDLEISPKSVVREMVENCLTFSGLVSRHDVGRSEGVVLRYLSDAYRALRQLVPDELMTEELSSVVEWLGRLIRSVDSSLLDEWEALASGRAPMVLSDEGGAVGVELAFGAREDGTVPLSANRYALRREVVKAMFHRVELAARDDVEALGRLDAEGDWDEAAWDEALGAYWSHHDWIGIDQSARSAALVLIDESPSAADLTLAGVSAEEADRLAGASWLVTQTLVDPDGDGDWRIVAVVDLAAVTREDRLVLRVVDFGSR